MESVAQDRQRIGVFDSGFGGLTVLRALLPLLPQAHFLYLGDTARLPYGAKSQTTIARYAVESARFLEQQGASRLVIACNTATALALPEIRAAVAIPVTGVVRAGALAAEQAASAQAHAGAPILVLATAATVQSHAYREACRELGLAVHEKACPLLVPLVEEGWTDHAVTRDVLRIYLREALAEIAAPAPEGVEAQHPGAVLLGCTHYPLIAPVIRETLAELGCNAPVVDSAEATAQEVRAAVHDEPANDAQTAATFECFATDSVEKFARLGSLFLGRTVNDVQLLDLGG